jgi:hypothetical protein
MFDWLLFPSVYCFLIETEEIALLEECRADWEYRYHCVKEIDLSCHLGSTHHYSSIDLMLVRHVS